ncbi:MAG: hypothetical protein ABI298_08475 [Acidimicrobiales bacterium]
MESGRPSATAVGQPGDIAMTSKYLIRMYESLSKVTNVRDYLGVGDMYWICFALVLAFGTTSFDSWLLRVEIIR